MSFRGKVGKNVIKCRKFVMKHCFWPATGGIANEIVAWRAGLESGRGKVGRRWGEVPKVPGV